MRRYRPPEDPAAKLLRILDQMDGHSKPAEVVPIAEAIAARDARERATEIDAENAPISQVRKKLIKDGVDLKNVDEEGRKLEQKFRGSSPATPKNE